jgi:hypothetical protein
MTTGNNIEKDFLAETLRSRLENQTMPVDKNCWAEIEQRMQKKRWAIPFWLWSAIGGAAAVAILFITLLPFTENPESRKLAIEMEKQSELGTPQNIASEILSENSGIDKKNSFETTHGKVTGATKSYQSKLTAKNNALFIAENKTAKIDAINETETTTNLSSEKETDIVNSNTNQNNSDFEKKQTEQQNETPVEKKTQINSLNELTTTPTKEYVRPKRKSERPLLAAAFGSGGGVDFSSSGYLDAAPLYENLADIKTTYARIMAPNEFSSITDISPLSFGLKISKEFAPNWSVESGLIYTYMATIYKGLSWGDIEADMNLHYLGIPVNLKHIVSKQKKWNIYFSGGVMIEKGLRSIYNQYTYSGNYTYKTVAKTKIDGFQWSMSGATGFSYDIFRDISTFFEPSVTWYFDNNQPRSARTQQPLVVGFNAGLRFKL